MAACVDTRVRVRMCMRVHMCTCVPDVKKNVGNLEYHTHTILSRDRLTPSFQGQVFNTSIFHSTFGSSNIFSLNAPLPFPVSPIKYLLSHVRKISCLLCLL